MKSGLLGIWSIVRQLIFNRTLLFDLSDIGENLLELFWWNILKIEGFH